MKPVNRCPHCGQQIRYLLRAGVYLTIVRSQIFDAIAAHPGITLEHLAMRLGRSKMTIRHLVTLIGHTLQETDYRILYNRDDGYHIVKICDKVDSDRTPVQVVQSSLRLTPKNT